MLLNCSLKQQSLPSTQFDGRIILYSTYYIGDAHQKSFEIDLLTLLHLKLLYN